MSGFEPRPAKRENVPLLLGFAGGTGSGKTMSALKVAKGLAGEEKFVVIDTEHGRAKFYADDFDFDHVEFDAPFSPARYLEAVRAVDGLYPVIVIDSASHEHAGDGGLLDMQEAELQRMAGDDYKKREAMTFTAWIKPKRAHAKFVGELLRLRAHVILCFRAAERIEIKRNAQGKIEVVPAKSAAGAEGWIPIAEKTLPYELTASMLLTADHPGVPKKIKIPEPLVPMIPLDKTIDETVGELLGVWARGSSEDAEPTTSTGTEATSDDGPLATPDDRRGIFDHAKTAGVTEERVREIILEIAGVEESKLIPRSKIQPILDQIALESV